MHVFLFLVMGCSASQVCSFDGWSCCQSGVTCMELLYPVKVCVIFLESRLKQLYTRCRRHAFGSVLRACNSVTTSCPFYLPFIASYLPLLYSNLQVVKIKNTKYKLILNLFLSVVHAVVQSITMMYEWHHIISGPSQAITRRYAVFSGLLMVNCQPVAAMIMS